MGQFKESDVHAHIFAEGLDLIDDDPRFDGIQAQPSNAQTPTGDELGGFELWRLMKDRALQKVRRIHRGLRSGTLIASKLKLPIDSTRPMELDFLGSFEDGLFVVELKVDTSAERNAFSELLGYSNYIAGAFALSGHRDITNVLIADLTNKITKQAFLYDLLIADRDTVVYRPVFSGGVSSLRLKIYFPDDSDFKQFANHLLSHDAMSTVVISFHDVPGWIDSKEVDSAPSPHTQAFLSKISAYAAQLMEAEHLHGFCFMRKRWEEIPFFFENSLVICALNPFLFPNDERIEVLVDQLSEEHISDLIDEPKYSFFRRLRRLGRRVASDTLKHGQKIEVESVDWAQIVHSPIEVVYTHNMAFHATGILREAYAHYIDLLYEENANHSGDHDLSTLKVEDVRNWGKAWYFMECCGFVHDGVEEADRETSEDSVFSDPQPD